MKIKQTLFIIILLLCGVVCSATLNLGVAYAAECGGVETSIISCDDKYKGVCYDGTKAYEGNDPNPTNETPEGGGLTEDEQTYIDTYGHAYGYCDKAGTVLPNTDISSTGFWGVLLLIINILTGAVGIAAVGGIVYGSILYASAGGSADQTKKGMEIIRNTIIGMVMYALMYAFLNYIIPGGLIG